MTLPVRSNSAKPKISCISMAIFLDYLVNTPATMHDIREQTGLCRHTCSRYLRAFHKIGLVHVSGWEPDSRGRDATPVFCWGPGRDVPRRKKSKAQVCREIRQRKKQAEVLAAMAGAAA